jgi:hypothetical protein
LWTRGQFPKQLFQDSKRPLLTLHFRLEYWDKSDEPLDGQRDFLPSGITIPAVPIAAESAIEFADQSVSAFLADAV